MFKLSDRFCQIFVWMRTIAQEKLDTEELGTGFAM